MRRAGHIYFIRCGDFVKVGFSTNHQARLLAISAHTPYDVKLEALHEGSISDERRFHSALAAFHHKLEWFRWCDEVRQVAEAGLPLLPKGVETPAERALDEARSVFGGDSGLARALGGITSQAISQWRRAPAQRVLDIEHASGISRHRLRPDLYPAAEPERASA